MGERARLERRGEGKRSRSAVKRVGGKSDQMRGKVKTGREWMTHLLVKVRAEREEDREEWAEQKTVVQSQSKKVRAIHLQPLALSICLSAAMTERASPSRRLIQRLARVGDFPPFSPLLWRLRIKATLPCCPLPPRTPCLHQPLQALIKFQFERMRGRQAHT